MFVLLRIAKIKCSWRAVDNCTVLFNYVLKTVFYRLQLGELFSHFSFSMKYRTRKIIEHVVDVAFLVIVAISIGYLFLKMRTINVGAKLHLNCLFIEY